jgi:electron transfer flavoprotein alpha subunit
MAHKVLTFVEQRAGAIKKSSLEALSLGKRLAEESGGTMAAVLAGEGVSGLVARIAEHGASAVYTADAAALALYSTEGYAAAIAQAVEKSGAEILVVSATAMGKDLAPRLAARLDWTYLADVTAAAVENGRLVVSRPQYAGKAEWKLAAPASRAVLTARPNVFPAAASPATNAETVAVDVAGVAPRARCTELKTSEAGMVDVAEADIIVAGGRGLKGPENFPALFDLAKALGAAVGASRAVVDAGWIDHEHQVGQTGKTVSPNLYFAFGISGAIQHLAGMRTSKRIVAVNKDPDAPVFKVADYGIVGDAVEIVPKLTEAVKRAKGLA